MKDKNFTRKMVLTATFFLGAAFSIYAQDMGTGTGWDNLNPSSALVLDEDFSGFDFFGNWVHANNSNSKPIVDETTGETIDGTNSGSKTIPFLNSTSTLTYTWDSCAFAPEWGVAYSVDGDGLPVDPDPTTTGVSNGFVEISRVYPKDNTLEGEFIVDLRNLDYVEGIQYTHSSCGGKRRGFVLLISLSDGVEWDTLRYQLGDHYSLNFTKDPFDWSKTPNDINCTPSGYGMLWEDAIYSENVMLKFLADSSYETQAVRIHDLKVYGDLKTSDEVAEFSNDLKIKVHNSVVNFSELAKVNVYSITGKLIQSNDGVDVISLNNLSNGIYIIKAQAGNKVATEKFVKR